MEQEIRNLIYKYEKQLGDRGQQRNKSKQTTKQKYRLQGYDAAVIMFISELKDVLYHSKVELTEKEMLSYTE